MNSRGGVAALLGWIIVSASCLAQSTPLDVRASALILDSASAVLPGTLTNFGCANAPGGLVQILKVGSNNVAHLPNLDGTPSGGDTVLFATWIGDYNGLSPCDLDHQLDTAFTPRPANGTKIFARVFDAATLGSANYWGQSATFGVNGSTVFDLSTAGLNETTVPKGINLTPTGLAATAGNHSVALSWTVSTGATSYNIYRSTTSGSGYSVIANAAVANYSDPSAVNDITYFYKVTAMIQGCESDFSVVVSATPRFTPVITTQPQSATVCNGLPVTFTSAGDGAAPLTKQWQVSADNGSTWSGIGSATSSTYNFTTVATDNGHKFRVIYSNSYGIATSSVAIVTVNPLPSVSVNSAVICVGGSAVLTATTSASNSSYLWSPGGATTASITVFPVSTTTYNVTVTDGTTTCANTSSGIVTVNPLPMAFTVTGGGSYCSDGNGASVGLNGSQLSANYQLVRDGTTNIGPTIPGTGGAISFGNQTLAGTYTVVATQTGNGCVATMVGGAVLVMNTAPSVTNPGNATKCEGESATFSVTGSGTGPLAYQWRKNSMPIGGATSSNYTINSVVVSDAGSYDCMVIGVCSPAATSSPATLIVNTGCVPASWLAHYNLTGSQPTDRGANGMTLLQSYLAGVDPTNPNRKLSISNISVSASGMLTVDWTSRQDGTTPQRLYDVYYHTGPFSNGVSWTRVLANEFPQSNTSGVEDDISAGAVTQRFYRITIAGHTNDVATPEIAGVHKLTLLPGANYISMSMLPVTNTLLSILGTNQLPQGSSESTATTVDIWNQTSQSFLVNNARYWLATADNGWIQHGSSTPHSGDDALLDPNKGLVITIRGTVNQTLRIVGFVPTSNEVQTVQGANGYTVASSTYPTPIALNALGGGDGSGLVTSGFLGGISLSRSDNLLFFNPVTQSFDTRIWFSTGDNKWHNADASIATKKLQPGEAFLIQRSTFNGHTGNITWTNTVPYTTTPQLQGP